MAETFRFTDAQRRAIDARGGAVLVSAAAGSGKTRVLTERLMAWLTDPGQPQELDRFLVITYTRAAAAELRSRISAAIAGRLAADPENRRLRRQSVLCARAQIGTIHSFCATLLRENAAAAALAPDFTVADDARAAALKTAALEKTLAQAYAHIDTDAAFRLLADTAGAGRDDARLGRLVLTLFEKMQCHARPVRWAQEQIERLQLAGVTDAGETVWGQELLLDAQRSADHWARELEALAQSLAAPGLEKLRDAYGGSLAETAAGLHAVASAARTGWDAARDALDAVDFPRLKAVRSTPDAALQEKIKTRREACKKAVEALRARFADSSETALGELAATAPAMERLLGLTLDFSARYAGENRRRALVDFSDLEHLTVQLLTDEDGAPTPLARDVAGRYTEILVDEYQDVSEVQERILRAVSDGGNNLFLVGDVKQSIYRFRLADPGIFLAKYNAWADDAAAAPGAPRRILLQENFRSRPAVLQAANLVFENLMSAALGELDYDENARLKPGATFAGADMPPELCLLALPEADDDAPAPEKTALEADYVAQRIRALVDSGAPVQDAGAVRAVDWGDIVILLRSANTVGPVYRRALTARGIPVASEQGGGFYDSIEISTLLSLLAVIDNPRQDVPLIAVLRSPLFGFSADDLAAVRASDRTHDFFAALTAAAETRADCRAALDTLESYRRLAPETEPGALLWHIYEDRALMALCCALPDGEARRRNLLLLPELARQFSQSGGHGLHRFVAWLRHQADRGLEPPVTGGERRAVRIMSIHKSKGLEFPVVFLCDLSRRFNKTDTRETVLVHPQLGLGPKRTDLRRGVEYPTFARSAVAARLERELLSEEMRLLYVAMTRAKERLVLTGTLANPEKALAELRAGLSRPLAPEVLRRAPSPLHWLLQASMLDEAGTTLPTALVPLSARAEEPAADAAAQPETPAPDAALVEALERKLDFVYPHAAATALPSKVTATELKRPELPETADGAALFAPAPRSFRMPDFRDGARPLTAAERGTATHRALQYLRFADAGDERTVRAQLDRLAAEGYLTARQAQGVQVPALLRLTRSPLGARLTRAEAAGALRREFQFSLLYPARLLFPEAAAEADEQVLLQGAIDCWFEEDGALAIVDYKTDRVAPADVPARAAHYAPQLRAYAAALARITGKRVRACTLFFLHSGETAELRPPEEPQA